VILFGLGDAGCPVGFVDRLQGSSIFGAQAPNNDPRENRRKRYGAEGGSRTRTSFRTTDFKSRDGTLT